MPRTDWNQVFDTAGNLLSQVQVVWTDEQLRQLQPKGESETISLGAYVLLTNVGATYDAIAAAKGLGVALVDFGGITTGTFTVFYQKVGTGTLSWQLWNHTDGAELARIDDTTAAGDNKVGSVNFTTFPYGPKLIRVRCKSTVAGDDPSYYGSTVRLS